MATYKIKKKNIKFHRLAAYLFLIPAVFLAVFYIAYKVSALVILPIAFLFLFASIEFFQIAFNINVYSAIKKKIFGKEHVFKDSKEKRKFQWVAYLSLIHTIIFVLLTIVLDLLIKLDYAFF